MVRNLQNEGCLTEEADFVCLPRKRYNDQDQENIVIDNGNLFAWLIKSFDECAILIFTPQLRLKREKKWFDIFAKVAWEN